VQESLRNSAETTAFLVDPLQLLNVEHPEGFAGTIFGTFLIFDPDNQDLEVVVTQIAQYVDNVAFDQMIYVGTQTLPQNSAWATEYEGDFWTVDLRVNTEVPIDIEG